MVSIRKGKKIAKKMGVTFKNPTDERRETLKIIKRQVNLTNKRLQKLDKKGFYNSFASKKLFNRLGGKVGALEKQGDKYSKVIFSNKMNMTRLTAIEKATKQFLNSSTSTPKRIESVVRRTKESMYATMKVQNDKLTMQDIELYYEMLGNSDFQTFADMYDPSTVWELINKAINEEDTKRGFIKRFESLNMLNDKDLRESALRLYDLYVG